MQHGTKLKPNGKIYRECVESIFINTFWLLFRKIGGQTMTNGFDAICHHSSIISESQKVIYKNLGFTDSESLCYIKKIPKFIELFCMKMKIVAFDCEHNIKMHHNGVHVWAEI